jgi:hypothetical protein
MFFKNPFTFVFLIPLPPDADDRKRDSEPGETMRRPETIEDIITVLVEGAKKELSLLPRLTGFFCPFIFKQTKLKGIHDGNPL